MNAILSVLMLVAGALVIGAIYLWRKGGPRRQVWLMLILAMVMVVNVLIWTVPDADGTAPLDRAGDIAAPQ
ncbi:conserved hypothetical protein [Altererythrobacter sp. B11]|uniref:hypothetical protein n=1 Tax=Altererythrobacter sp. B11 TaxID=2060312 RepID=UPI000DC73688|nr:hypothetical protein [Altererythrobacter sp. B11]BBC73748.1 conserved hypothetical protein [Altererythrobacter sp. B11]